MNVCDIIASYAIKYNAKNEAIFDGIIDLVFNPLYNYVVRGKLPASDFRESHASKLLWLYLCAWGNIINICRNENLRNGDIKVINELKKYSKILDIISNEKPEPVLILILLNNKEYANKLEELFDTFKEEYKGFGTISIAKMLFILSAGRLPLMDGNILKCIGMDADNMNGKDYIKAAKALLKLADHCYSKLQETHNTLRKNSNKCYSIPRNTIIKTLDEGLWLYLQTKKNSKEEIENFCNKIRNLISI